VLWEIEHHETPPALLGYCHHVDGADRVISDTAKILVATDFSDAARRALAVGAHYARAMQARIHLLHISPAAGMDATQPVEDVIAEAGRDVSITIVGRSGEPAEEIIRYAASHPIDLIVMGTHGRTGFSRVLLGSVVERVLRGAPCPVLVVPPRAELGPGPSTSSEPAAEAAPAAPPVVERRCLVCAAATRDLICEPCRTRIRGEALQHKRAVERAGSRTALSLRT
jgi:nucleotide-binding universal stress UspA family protein